MPIGIIYDSLDRLVETILPDPDGVVGNAIVAPHYGYEYDAAGRLIRSVSPDPVSGLVWSGGFDANGRRNVSSGASTTERSGRCATCLTILEFRGLT